MSSVAHGWPDGEARPLPFGALLASANGVTVGGGGQIDFADLAVGAWQALGFAIATGGRPVDVSVSWLYVGEATIQPATIFTHPGTQSLLLIPCRGQIATGISFSTTPGTVMSYAVLGANRPADSDSGQGRMRSIVVPDPGAGVGTVEVYQPPPGAVGIVHAVEFLMTWGAATNNNPPAIDYVDLNGRQLTYAELRITGGAGDSEIISANSQQGGTSGVVTNTTLPENSWTVSRMLPQYRLPETFTTRIVLNDAVADDEISNIIVLVEEF